jgi:hypothetical protein
MERVLTLGAILGATAVLSAAPFGPEPLAGALLGSAGALLGLRWLDGIVRSLLGMTPRRARVLSALSGLLRLGYWAILAAAAASLGGGAPAGFVAGFLAVKAALLIEGIRAR